MMATTKAPRRQGTMRFTGQADVWLRCILVFAGLALLLGTLASCRTVRIGGKDSTEEVLIRLRRDNARHKADIKSIKKQLDLAQSQAVSLEQQLNQRDVKVDNVDANHLPRTVKIELHRLSGAVDTDKDGRDDTLRLYVVTLDQHGRFYPAVGTAQVRGVVIHGQDEPAVVIDKNYSAAQFFKTYRAGFTGTHYTLEMSLPSDMGADVEQINIKVTFTDASTGTSMTAQEAIEIRRDD